MTYPTEPANDSGVYPTELRQEMKRASYLARSLTLLVDRVGPDDPSFLWLVGRAGEVRTLVAAWARDWSEGTIDAHRAAHRVRAYLRGVEESLHAFFRPTSRRAATFAGFHPQSDTVVNWKPPAFDA
jgi:hypothetical protein